MGNLSLFHTDRITDDSKVTKANNLIEARINMSLWELRVITRVISLINPYEDKHLGMHKIYIKDLMNFFGATSNNDYDIIKNVPISLSQKSLVAEVINEETGDKGLRALPILSDSMTMYSDHGDENKAYIVIEFNSKLTPFLLNLGKLYHYRTYRIEHVAKFRRKYSYRFYELLKQWEKIGERPFNILDLKEILGLFKMKQKGRGWGRVPSSEKYKKYHDFIKRVVDPAIEEINEFSDLIVTYSTTTEKRSKKVQKIVFKIKHKAVENVAVEEKPTESFVYNSIYSIIKSWKTTPSKSTVDKAVGRLQQLFAQDHEYQSLDEKGKTSFIESRIKQLVLYIQNRIQNGKTVDNPAGLFVELTKSKDFTDPALEVKKKEEAKKKLALQQKQKDRDRQEKIQALEGERFAAKWKKVTSLFEDENQKDNVEGALLNARKISGTLDLMNPAHQGSVVFMVDKMNPGYFDKIDQHYQPLIDMLK